MSKERIEEIIERVANKYSQSGYLDNVANLKDEFNQELADAIHEDSLEGMLERLPSFEISLVVWGREYDVNTVELLKEAVAEVLKKLEDIDDCKL